MRQFNFYKIIFSLLPVLLIGTSLHSQEIKRKIIEINENYIVLAKYIRLPDDTQYFSNLQVYDAKPENLGRFLQDSSVDPILTLIENGSLIISNRDFEKDEKRIIAENKAKKAQVGYWTPDHQNFLRIFKIVVYSIGIGLIAFLIRLFYIHFIKNKRVNLIYIGLPAVGKTALHYRLTSEPNETDILSTMSSIKVDEIAKRSFPLGRHEIYPVFKDMPGSKQNFIWEEIYKIPTINIRYVNQFLNFILRSPKTVIICVLSPCIESGYSLVNNDYAKNVPVDFEPEFMNEQLGYLKAMLAGLGSVKMKVSKPKIIIGFINKFDLFSEHNPSDISSNNSRQIFLAKFSNHVAFLKKCSEDAEIPYEIVIGSTLQDWQTNKIALILEKKLYPNKS